MKDEALQAINDAMDEDLPENTDSFNKIKCCIANGTRVWWYYRDDLEYFKEWGEEGESAQGMAPWKGMAPWSGIAVSLPGVEYNGSMDENIVIVVDTEPCEKCYPEIEWVALNKLINDDNLVEIFTK